MLKLNFSVTVENSRGPAFFSDNMEHSWAYFLFQLSWYRLMCRAYFAATRTHEIHVSSPMLSLKNVASKALILLLLYTSILYSSTPVQQLGEGLCGTVPTVVAVCAMCSFD